MRELYLLTITVVLIIISFLGVKYYVYHLDEDTKIIVLHESNDTNGSIVENRANFEQFAISTKKVATLIPLSTNQQTKRAGLFRSIQDQEFGTEITRVTDIKKHPSRFLVARVQFWNSDSSLIRLGHQKIFDAKTHEYLGKIAGRMYEVKWSHTHPNILFALHHAFKKNASQSKINPKNDFLFFAIDVRHGFKRELIARFPQKIYSDVKIGPWEGNIDQQDKYVVFSAKKRGSDHLVAILYDIKSKQEIAYKEFKEIKWTSSRKSNQHDWISISPFGNSILHAKCNHASPSFDKFHIEQYDLDFMPIRMISAVSEHGDLGINVDGEEVYVQFRDANNRHGIYAFNLNNDQVVSLSGTNSYGGGHISCQNYQRKGWCYVSTKGKNYREVFALKLDGSGEVERFAQTHGIEESRESSKGTPSPDGSQVLFQSTWGVLNRTEAYVVTRAKR